MRFRRSVLVLVALLTVALLGGAGGLHPPVPTTSTPERLPVVRTPVRLAAAEIIYEGRSVYTCGHVSCSFYLNRRATRSVADAVGRYENTTTAAFGSIFAAACAATGAGAVAVTLCAGAGATAGSLAVDQFVAAGDRGQCMRMYYYYIPDPFNAGDPFLPVSPPSLTPDDSGYCRNG